MPLAGRRSEHLAALIYMDARMGPKKTLGLEVCRAANKISPDCPGGIWKVDKVAWKGLSAEAFQPYCGEPSIGK